MCGKFSHINDRLIYLSKPKPHELVGVLHADLVLFFCEPLLSELFLDFVDLGLIFLSDTLLLL